jgi:hypothetical protein
MGNTQKEFISEFIDESQLIQSLMKTESPWQETELFSNSKEGPVVIKTLKKVTATEQ